MIRILHVAYHRDMRRRNRVLQELNEHIRVVAVTSDQSDAIDMTKQLLPDVVVMQMGHPQMNWRELLRRFHVECGETRLIAYMTNANREFVQTALRFGAAGCVLESSSTRVLRCAIERVHRGKDFFDPGLSTRRNASSPVPCIGMRHTHMEGTSCVGTSESLVGVSAPDGENQSNSPEEPVGASVAFAGEVTRYVKSNLTPLLSVKEVAAALGKHPADLDRMFRRTCGVTLKRYIDSQCRNLVEARLKGGTVKGYELAIEFGFRTDQAFYRWVKRVFGKCLSELH